jgi:hypothetical protein
MVTITTPQLAWDDDNESANIDDLDPSLGSYEVTYCYKEDLEDVISSFSWENCAETEVTDSVAMENGEDCASRLFRNDHEMGQMHMAAKEVTCRGSNAHGSLEL